MPDPTLPTITLAPVNTADDVSASMDPRLARMLLNLKAHSLEAWSLVNQALEASPNLMEEFNTDVANGTLNGFWFVDNPNQTGMYFRPGDSNQIVITQDFLNSTAGDLNAAIFAFGHEGYHSLDATNIAQLTRDAESTLVSAIGSGQDVTSVLSSYAQELLDDEGNANMAGWNALLDSGNVVSIAALAQTPRANLVVQDWGDGQGKSRGAACRGAYRGGTERGRLEASNCGERGQRSAGVLSGRIFEPSRGGTSAVAHRITVQGLAH